MPRVAAGADKAVAEADKARSCGCCRQRGDNGAEFGRLGPWIGRRGMDRRQCGVFLGDGRRKGRKAVSKAARETFEAAVVKQRAEGTAWRAAEEAQKKTDAEEEAAAAEDDSRVPGWLKGAAHTLVDTAGTVVDYGTWIDPLQPGYLGRSR
ncbi:hypothetical protein [Streptomyces huasconensis]|uniref:hypothetical protein n=1 Tax=Streptomyces huasconensis TaxID=1854574 RepID=UPI0036F5F5BD